MQPFMPNTIACDVFWSVFNTLKEGFPKETFDRYFFIGGNGALFYGAELRGARSGCELMRLTADACLCNSFDEQLRFVSAAGVPLSHIDYRISLSDGERWQGSTDAEGRTARIGSKAAATFDKVEFIARRGSGSCCSVAPEPEDGDTPSAMIKTLELNDVSTTEHDYGSSVREVTVKVIARPMTQGEIDMAWMIFQDAVDYSKVRIHNEPYLWFGLQPKNVAMTPNGEMYFHESTYSSDFSQELISARRWFIHEMVHIWQYQLGYPVKWRGAIRIGLGYEYSLEPESRLASFNMEAQGELLADYFALKYLNAPREMSQPRYWNDLDLYEKVLHDFFIDRHNPQNLPGHAMHRGPGDRSE